MTDTPPGNAPASRSTRRVRACGCLLRKGDRDAPDGMAAAPRSAWGNAGAGLAGGGAMGALIRSIDWSTTPLGRAESWPQSLKTAVDLMLNSRYAMFVWWGRELINLYNDAYRPFLGRKHPGALGRSARDVWSEIWDLIGPRTEAVLERGEATFDEALLLVMERYGYPEETYFTFSYSPIRDDQGGVGGIFCAVMDTTLSVIGERRLKLLRDVAAKAPDAHTPEEVCTAAADCIASNARDLPFALLYLAEPEGTSLRLVARTGIDLDSPAAPPLVDLQKPDAAWPFAEVLATRAPLVLEDLASRFERLPNGAWDRPPARAAVTPLSEQGQTSIAGFLITGLNPYLPYEEGFHGFVGLLAGQIAAAIANARAYEEERKRAEALAEIDRAKTAFFSNVSHEFRTPLTLMLGPLEDALSDPATSARERERLDLAHRNALRLLNLVNSLLDFSRIEAGRAQASYEPVDLAALTAELASNFRSACERAGLRLTIDCPSLPQPVHVDRDMWEKIVLNLLSNAFKFTFDGEIAVHLQAREAHAVLSVRDTGVGVPEAELPRLFQRFYRIEGQRSRTHEGSGIGLALAQELVKLHGGTIDAESRVDEGTVFTIAIPFGTTHLPGDRIGAARRLAATSVRAEAYVEEALRWLPDQQFLATAMAREEDDAPLPQGAHILVADDNADMRSYLRRLLGPSCTVETVSDGEAALAAIHAHRPDLVLTDIMMPRLDGFGLLRAIRGDPALADLPVIMLSARAGEESRVDGLDAGADDYLVKPFSARELSARVSARLELSRVRREAMAALRESERRTRELFRQAPGFIAILDGPDHVFAFANDSYRQLAGGRDLLGKSVREVFPEIAGQGFFELLDSVYRTGRPFTGREIQVDLGRRPDGGMDRVFLDFVYQPITRGNGEVTGVFVEGFEVTDRVGAQTSLRDSEERLRELNDSLERKVAERSRALEAEVAEREKIQLALQQAQRLEAIGQLTGGVAHDFNNLLTVVVGQAEAIIANAKRDERIIRMATAVQRAAERGARLTTQLLAFARRQPLQPVTIALPALLANTGDLMRRAIGETVAVEIAVEPGLWPCRVDPAQFESAILNLAINARDAMPDGGTLVIRAANLTLDAAEASRLDLAAGDYVAIAVTDGGAGMTEEVRDRAFEPFFTTKDIGKGTGLGLAQVYGFARQSGGAAAIESAVGRGTTVTMYFPRVEPANVIAEASADEPAAMRGNGKTILLVEDQAEVREVITMALEDFGFRILTATDGIAAQRILEGGEAIDLLLTDVVMPNGVSGLALAQDASRLRPNIKIVLVSGYLSDKDSRMAALPGARLLAKPFTHAQLAETLAAALDDRPARR